MKSHSSMINWMLQKNLTKPDILEQIKSALIKDDVKWEEVEVIPFSESVPKSHNPELFNVVYGSTTFMLNAYKDEDLKKGVFYHPDTFQMKNYVDKWGDNILNSEGELMKFGKLAELESELDKEWFIRPNHDGKEFSGRVDTFKNLKKWSEEICQLALSDFNKNTEVWIAQPKKILKEWRLFVVADDIVSSCRYMKNGELDEDELDIPEDMIKYANTRIREYRLDDVYVMDIAQVENGFKLIECNCFNGTGFYKHDIGKVITAVNTSIRKTLGYQN